nr:mannitol dehydrogenase family protein [uncultured Butyrivibrio sp.]
MKLNYESLKNNNSWKEKGYFVPSFDREKMIEETKANPEWVHFGAGNIFRAFQANLSQRMLEEGFASKGITVVEGFDYEIIEKMYRPHDNLSILVTLKADGNVEKSVIESIAESCILDSNNEKEFARLKDIFSADSLKLATFTITEKGYSLVNGAGEMLPAVAADFENGPEKPQSYIGKVSALLYARYLAGKKKIAMVSTDNCSHNGDKLFAAVSSFAKAWTENGKAEAGFKAYIEDESLVSFPWSMIDKITPRPDESVNEILKNDGVEELEPVVTSMKTWVAPFVNAEESEYLVIEDKFPNGRPALEKVGVIFTDKETVDKVERMKVCTCLNPLHTALAVYGCILGFTKISDEMKDETLVKLVKTIGYVEGLPVVTDPGVIKPQEFIDTVVNVRIPNVFMPDTPQRIACDTSQKLPIRFGETIKAYAASDKLDVQDLKLIPLVHAGWLRYLMGLDDNGNSFEPSPDPLLEKAQAFVKDIKLGETDEAKVKDKVLPLLKDATIFGVDLEKVGLADRVISYFVELIAGTGAVRKTLEKYVG